MNHKGLVVLLWAALSGYVIFRDGLSSSGKALQELVGIWLLSIIALGIGEMSDTLALLSEAFLAVDVVLQPGGSNAGANFAQTVSKILPAPTPTATAAPSQPQKVMVV